jgi:hypothetical protein
MTIVEVEVASGTIFRNSLHLRHHCQHTLMYIGIVPSA